MGKRVVLATLVLAVACAAAGAQAGLKADNDPSAQEAVKKAETDAGSLLAHGQWDQYAALLSDDYVFTASSGQTRNREQTMAELRAEKSKVLDVMPEEMQVRIYGNTAVCTGHRTELMRENGRVSTVFTRFTDVFVKRDSAWMLAASQETRVKN